MDKVVFDPSLGRHGGTRYRGAGGHFVPNPDRGQLWCCQKSPTGAHHWLIDNENRGRCKCCGKEREFRPVIKLSKLLKTRLDEKLEIGAKSY